MNNIRCDSLLVKDTLGTEFGSQVVMKGALTSIRVGSQVITVTIFIMTAILLPLYTLAAKS